MARKGKTEDDGYVEFLAEVGWNCPALGWAFAVVLCGVAAAVYFLPWMAAEGSMASPGERILRPLFAMFLALLAAVGALMALIGTIRCLVTGRDLLGRSRSAVALARPTAETMRAMSWRDFERYVADLYRRQAYHVEVIGGPGDGGVDLVLRKDGRTALVQCKLYRKQQVGVAAVREFYGAMAGFETRCEGLFATCGTFTEDARQFAAGKPLRLIDGAALAALVERVNPLKPPVTPEASHASPAGVQSHGAASVAAPANLVATPACPRCGHAMVVRDGRRGAFWGCSTYGRTGCRGTVQVAR